MREVDPGEEDPRVAAPHPRDPGNAVVTRASILDAARELILLGQPLSVGRVATASGSSRRAVRAHFASTDVLLEVIAVTATQDLLAQHRGARGASATHAWSGMIATIWADAAFLRALLVLGSAAGAPILRELLQPVLWTKVEIVQRGQREGAFRTDVAAPELGERLHALVLVMLRDPAVTAAAAQGRTFAMLVDPRAAE